MFHIHFAKESFSSGVYWYETCRCGARRSVQGFRGYSPLLSDWPPPREGWVKPDE